MQSIITNINNRLLQTTSLGFWKAIWVTIVYTLCSFVVLIPTILIDDTSFTSAEIVLKDMVLYSILGNSVGIIGVLYFFAKKNTPTPTISMIPLDKRSYKMIWLFLLGYAVIALGSMNRIVEAVPIGQLWEELFLEMEALY
ncbi:MAG: hypothetical protein ACRCWQ_06200, partial [Bacilli bacterium]